jgi:hypothetical protein
MLKDIFKVSFTIAFSFMFGVGCFSILSTIFKIILALAMSYYSGTNNFM